jgi:penicillin-binding protein 2
MFVAFAPRENPKIAVAVAIENGGFGATWGGPIASLMIEQYLNDSISIKRVALLKKMQNTKIIINYTYLKDSLDRQKFREKELLKNGNKDSLRKVNYAKDSIKHSNDSLLARYYFQKVYGKKLNN